MDCVSAGVHLWMFGCFGFRTFSKCKWRCCTTMGQRTRQRRQVARKALACCRELLIEPRTLNGLASRDMTFFSLESRCLRFFSCIYLICEFSEERRNILPFAPAATAPRAHLVTHLLKALPLIGGQDLLQALVRLFPDLGNARLRVFAHGA